MPSRGLVAWLVLTHALGALGVMWLPIAWPSKLGLITAVAAHAYVRRPRRPEPIVRNRSGVWALPASGRTGLSLHPRTRHGTWWAELRLVGAHGVYRRLLCRDQLREEEWRVLKLTLSRPAARHDLS